MKDLMSDKEKLTSIFFSSVNIWLMIYGLGLWCKALSTAGRVWKVLLFKGKKMRARLKGVAETARPSVVTPDSKTLPWRQRSGKDSSSIMGCTDAMRVGQAATSPCYQTGHKTKLETHVFQTKGAERFPCPVSVWLTLASNDVGWGICWLHFNKVLETRAPSLVTSNFKMENHILFKNPPHVGFRATINIYWFHKTASELL